MRLKELGSFAKSQPETCATTADSVLSISVILLNFNAFVFVDDENLGIIWGTPNLVRRF